MAGIEVVKILEMLGRRVLESRKVAEPFEIDIADRAIPLLRDDDLRLPGKLLAIFAAVVVFLAVYEEHDIRVLLDRTRLSQM